METDEMMDDDLFADLYGDEDPKKTESNSTKAATAQNGMGPTAAKLAAQVSSVTSAPDAATGTEKATDPRPASNTAGANTQTQTNQPTTSTEANGNAGGEDSYQGWEMHQGKRDVKEGSNNDYQGYGGYEPEGDGYGDYSGGGGGNMVDVGGSTAIKEDGKMFIGGLNWETTDESLKNYFSQFGEVTECTVMRDGTTGRSRGFGFLTFKDPKTVNIVMVKEHYLDGKIIDPKRAIPRDEQEKTSKIFVGGVSQEATETDFREYFTQFGRVLDATLMMDKDTGRPRGFGFVTFDSEAAVENALNHPNLEIMGKAIEVKKAQPRGNPRGNMGHEDRDESRGGFRDRNNQRGAFNQDGGAPGNSGGTGYGQQAANGTGATGQPGQAVYNGMSPQVMAQYWQRMQAYMAAFMQQQQAAAGRGRGVSGTPTPAVNPMMMNPAMLQQFQQMQQMQMAQQGQAGMSPNAGMAGMSAMGAMGMGGMGGGPQGPQQQLQGGHQGPYGGQQAGYGGAGGGYGGHQQHDGGYDHSGQQSHGGVHSHGGNMGHNNSMDPRYQRQAKDYQSHHQRDFNPQQQQTSWEGMYDDVPSQPNPQHHHGHSQQQGMNNVPQGPQQQQNQQRAPPVGPSAYNTNNNPSNAQNSVSSGPPPNAPTGPRAARNPVGPAAFRNQPRGGVGGMQGGGVGPMRGTGGFSRGAAVGGMPQGPAGVGGHGYHPYARNQQGGQGGGGERGVY